MINEGGDRMKKLPAGKRIVAIMTLIIVFGVGLTAALAQETDKINITGSQGRGLTVEPGVMMIQNVTPGEPFDLYEVAQITLTINNRSDRARIFDIEPKIPSEAMVNMVEGYSDIPDATWLRLEKNSLRLTPFSQGHIKMRVNVPKSDEFYNQNWAVALNVKTRPEPGEKLALAVKPIYYIETIAKENVRGKPYGVLGIVPSRIRLEEAALGRTRGAGEITIYNNDNKVHIYDITSYIPPEELTRKQKQKISLSAGYQWIEDERWILPAKRRVKIAPHRSVKISFDLNIPSKLTYRGKKYEGVIKIKSDDNKANFMRILLDT